MPTVQRILEVAGTESRAKTIASAIAMAVTLGANDAWAAEGAASNYFPGGYGDFFVSVAPDPGPVFVDLSLFYSADVSTAVLQGTVDTSLEAQAYYNLLMGLYVWDAPALNGRFAVGGYLPLGYSSLDASIGPLSVSGEEFDLGDVGIIPASFFWNSGNFHVNLYELIVAPTGQYSTGNVVNVGRNYWSFDTVMALTWFNPESGTEFSVVPGIMFNTRNDATDYKTGTEFHVDFMANQFLSETFAIGLHGYYYGQLSGDSGTGALLGAFKGESFGLGPAFAWIPPAGGGKVSITGKWLHDLHSENRLKADYGELTIAVTF
jgi:hypothetical protein